MTFGKVMLQNGVFGGFIIYSLAHRGVEEGGPMALKDSVTC